MPLGQPTWAGEKGRWPELAVCPWRREQRVPAVRLVLQCQVAMRLSKVRGSLRKATRPLDK